MTFEKNVLQPIWNLNPYQARVGDGFGSLGGTEKSLVDLFNERMNQGRPSYLQNRFNQEAP